MKKTKRVALITGGAKRIGASIARHLHHCGVDVMIHHNQSSIDAKNLVAELNNLRVDSAATIQADLLDQESFNCLIKEVINIFGQANDILIAVEERKNFIIRTVLAIALVILIFSLFLNKYILLLQLCFSSLYFPNN